MIGNAQLIGKCSVMIGPRLRYFFFFDNKEIYWQDEGCKDWHLYEGGWPFAVADCLEVFNNEKFNCLFAEWED